MRICNMIMYISLNYIDVMDMHISIHMYIYIYTVHNTHIIEVTTHQTWEYLQKRLGNVASRR